MKLESVGNEKSIYLKQYYEMVYNRCGYLLSQADEIASVTIFENGVNMSSFRLNKNQLK